MGFGFFTIFQSALNYLIDTFQKYAASAVAANTFLRSIFAASFPLFVNPMYHHLGIPWASSIFAFFAVLLIPIPYLFFVFGKSLRKRGTFGANSCYCERIYVARHVPGTEKSLDYPFELSRCSGSCFGEGTLTLDAL